MRKPLFTLACLLLLGGAHRAQAQVGAFIDLVRLTVGLGVVSATNPYLNAAQRGEQPGLPSSATPAELVMRRTPTDRLPQHGAEEIVRLETELERCHAVLLGSPTAVIIPPQQKVLVQAAVVAVARAAPRWELHLYQQEMAFYAAEDARRQQAPAQ